MDLLDLDRTPIRPYDDVTGQRVMVETAVGMLRGWRADGPPKQGRDVAGYGGDDPHSWWQLVIEEDAWYEAHHTGVEPVDGACRWAPLGAVFMD